MHKRNCEKSNSAEVKMKPVFLQYEIETEEPYLRERGGGGRRSSLQLCCTAMGTSNDIASGTS